MRFQVTKLTKVVKITAVAGAFAAILTTAAWASRDDAADYPSIAYDLPAIDYVKNEPNDPITKLQAKMNSGEVKLDYDAKWGYLPSVLKHLNVSTDSQTLIFSKTSFQGPKISPKRPRAVYFNDNVGVGFVPDGDVMEFTALDPKQGIIFYTMQREKVAKPTFDRRNEECLNCHVIPGTLYIPGLLATSVFPAPDGSLRLAAAAVIVDSRTPLDQRWGGWYVTGMSGGLQHRGNAVAPSPDEPTWLDLRHAENIMSLEGRIEVPYLSAGSDIVALMVLDHQTRMTDFLTRLSWESRVAAQEGKLEEFKARLGFVTDELVSYMLFADEAKIYSPISGSSTFAQTFSARGPRDKQGRSLRDFDLKTRMFRYPLSYMIYDAAFDALPDMVKDQVYRKLFAALTSEGAKGKFPKLSAEDRKAILEIVRDTKPGLPDYWRS